jgi:hypothetical protein
MTREVEDFTRSMYADALRYARGAGHSALLKYEGVLDPGKLKRLVREFERALIPRRKPGRKLSTPLTVAAQQLQQGVSWPVILQSYLAASGSRLVWNQMGEWRKKAEWRKLHQRIRGRLRRVRKAAKQRPDHQLA